MLVSFDQIANVSDYPNKNIILCQRRFYQLWRRRSRRNSLSDSRRNSMSVNGSSAATHSLDRRSLCINPSTEKCSATTTPFGSTGGQCIFVL
jgi:hypothetical protein